MKPVEHEDRISSTSTIEETKTNNIFESDSDILPQNTDEFLNSHEKHYLENLKRNEALLEYFQSI